MARTKQSTLAAKLASGLAPRGTPGRATRHAAIAVVALGVALGIALATGAATPSPSPTASRLPGAEPHPDALAARLAEAVRARAASGEAARTRHRTADGAPRYTNRLALATSPYLLQHAHNPVDWRPWGDEAFADARRLGRPVLVSIGYSTCHWCHVMEEESFEDEEIAAVLNSRFIAIKVDREERPDVDAVYMTAVQSLTGGGGWPMTVFVTPERRPFFAGTYFPPRDGQRGAEIGFRRVLRQIDAAWTADPATIDAAARELAATVERRLRFDASGGLPDGALLERAARAGRDRFDPDHGGAAGAPKFPSGLPLRFLLRHHRRTGDAEALRMATLTLERMAAGGIRDHVGGGFHRYATDASWTVPHFEKMLYDNALLAVAYVEAWQATGDPAFAEVARTTLGWIEREMTAPEGGFYSATDADSPAPSGGREEGLYFTWTPAELESALGRERAGLVAERFGVTAPGDLEGRSVLRIARPLADLAAARQLAPAELDAALAASLLTLRDARARRPPPLRDDKVLTAWNALAISAFARAAFAFDDPAAAAIAGRAADFVLTRLRRDGRLLRSFRAGRADGPGYLEDHAFLLAALLDLYEATGRARWLEEAIAIDAVLAARFEDPAGGFFRTAHDHEKLLAREKPTWDGAEPSGNAVAVLSLLRLHELTGKDAYRGRATAALRAVGTALASRPLGYGEMLLAADFLVDSPREIVIAAPTAVAEAAPLLAELRRSFVPNRVLVVLAPGAEGESVVKRVPLARGKVAQRGRPTAYVCVRGVCALPTADPATFAAQLRAPAASLPSSSSPSPTSSARTTPTTTTTPTPRHRDAAPGSR